MSDATDAERVQNALTLLLALYWLYIGFNCSNSIQAHLI